MFVSHLECPKCQATYDSGRPVQVCKCGSPLLVRYDLKEVERHFNKESLRNRAANLWRYREMLPVREEKNQVCLGEGMTPLIRLSRLGSEYGMSNLYMKDEGIIPTGTFKARERRWVFLRPKSLESRS